MVILHQYWLIKCLCLLLRKLLEQAVLGTLDKNLEKSIGDFDVHLDQSLNCKWLRAGPGRGGIDVLILPYVSISGGPI